MIRMVNIDIFGRSGQSAVFFTVMTLSGAPISDAPRHLPVLPVSLSLLHFHLRIQPQFLSISASCNPDGSGLVLLKTNFPRKPKNPV